MSGEMPSAKLTNQHRVVDGLEKNNTSSRSNARHSCELGVVGAEQADESNFDDRMDAEDDADFDDNGRIHFSRKKLYGRDPELGKLQEIYNRLSNPEEQPGCEVVFLSGYSGCGKTRLVNEFVKQFADQNVVPVFIEGKYDELQTPDPYTGVS